MLCIIHVDACCTIGIVVQVRSNLDRLLAKIPDLGDVLRGSLIHRKTFHSQGCAKCPRGVGHPQWVLNVNYVAVSSHIRKTRGLFPGLESAVILTMGDG